MNGKYISNCSMDFRKGEKTMRIDQINHIYESIQAIFNGDKRPLDLAGILPIKLEDLRTLLLYTELIDTSGNLHYDATQDKFCFVISIYYSMRQRVGFTKPLGAIPMPKITLPGY